MCRMKMQRRTWSFSRGYVYQRATQQRLVHRQEFTLPTLTSQVEQLSVDGGKVRLRTPLKEACVWRDYKAVRLHGQATTAEFQDNAALPIVGKRSTIGVATYLHWRWSLRHLEYYQTGGTSKPTTGNP